MRVLQIDDGFTPEMGDWLEVKPQFPRGMKPLLDDIRSTGDLLKYLRRRDELTLNNKAA